MKSNQPKAHFNVDRTCSTMQVGNPVEESEEKSNSYSSYGAEYYDGSYSYSDAEIPAIPNDYKEYEDLTPLPRPKQIPGFFEVSYSTEYSKLMGYFFALYQKKEYSQRALKLCDKIIDQYCTHNAAWTYKIEIYKHIGYDPKEVQKYLEDQMVNDTKIYSAWNAYQWLINENEIDPIPLLNKIFNIEPKNFHAWSFSVWYAKRWNKAKEIYDIALQEIEKDVFNNSAWNTRRVCGDALNIEPEKEFDSAAEIMLKTPHNESARNFLFGLCEKDRNLIPKLDEIGQKLVEMDKDNFNGYRFLLFNASLQNNEEAINNLCDELIRTDPIRVNYYTLVKNGQLKYE